MPKQPLKAEVNAFVKGLITEASPLNFPPNSTSEEQNFLLKRTGERSRRNGIDFETDYSLIGTGETEINNFPSTHVWASPNGDSSKTFAVVQVGTKIYFLDMDATVLSASGYLGSLELFNSENSFTPVDKKFSFASLEGFLVAAAGQESVAIVSWNGSSFSVEYGRIRVRDLWGIEV